MELSHGRIWGALDAVAARLGTTPSGLARSAGLDPTAFNRSKRMSADTPPRPRWPSTESLAKVLQAAGMSFSEFADLAAGAPARGRGVPLIGFAQAGADGFFDDAGFPVGHGWEVVDPPAAAGEGVYALAVSGDSMLPLYRNGDRIVVDPQARVRPGDRVVVKTLSGEVMAKELTRLTESAIEVRSLNPAFGDRVLPRSEVAWIGRIVWASQ